VSMRWNGSALGLVLVFALLGCATAPPTRFYALSAEPVAAIKPSKAAPGLVLAVGPVDLPEYLRRPQIVTRPGENRLEVSEFDRWGGALEEEITRVVTQQLGATLGTTRVYSYPSRIMPDIDLRIPVNVRTFDGTLGGEAVLDAAWSIIDERRARVLDTRQSVYRVPVNGTGYAAYAVAMSACLAQLSRDIAGVVVARAGQVTPRASP